MNTNSNVYTVIYTTIVVVIVAAVLAFASQKLGPAQADNAKAETLRQMMIAAQVATDDDLYASKNAQVISLYADQVDSAFTIGVDGVQNGTLSTELKKIELVSNLKPQNKAILSGKQATLPVYVFKSGVSVFPIYGAGLWGPIWGYIALSSDCETITGAYFDHESETPGLGAKIKDEEWFREKFAGKKIAFGNEVLFNLSKNAELTGDFNAVDAITGATMTSKGLDKALNVWMKAYESYFQAKKAASIAAQETPAEEIPAEETKAVEE